MAGSTEVVHSVAELESLIPEWDELAARAGLPTCTGTWMVACAGVHDEAVRVAVVRDGGAIVGIVPLVVRPGRHGTRELHLLAADVAVGSAPLAAPGWELEVAERATAALAAVRPRADWLVLDGLSDARPWAALLADAWPGAMRRLVRREHTTTESIVLCVDGGYDAWLGRRSARFRSQLRRHQRRLEALGIRARVTSSAQELPADLAALSHLHRARWAPRGGSGVMTAPVERMLAQAAPRLLAQGRLVMVSLENDQAIVGSHLWLNAGGHHVGWLGGFDPALKGEPLDFVGMTRAIEEAFAIGATDITLGPGGQESKRRLTDATRGITSWRLPLHGPRVPLVLGSVAVRNAHARHVRRRAAQTG